MGDEVAQIEGPPEADLPAPILRDDAYLAAILEELKAHRRYHAAILEELQGLRADLARAPDVKPEVDASPDDPVDAGGDDATPTKSLLSRIMGG